MRSQIQKRVKNKTESGCWLARNEEIGKKYIFDWELYRDYCRAPFLPCLLTIDQVRIWGGGFSCEVAVLSTAKQLYQCLE